MPGEGVPQNDHAWIEPCLAHALPDHGAGGLRKTVRLQAFAAGAPGRTGKNHARLQSLRTQMAEQQALRGHGNAGEMPALISQSFGQQDDPGLPPLFQIGPQLGPADARRPGGGVVFQIPLIPRVKNRSNGSGAYSSWR